MESLGYASRSQRIRHCLANAIVFALCYNASNDLAAKKKITRSVAISLDTNIPFWEWMILPYLCSGLFFVGSFILVTSLDNLRVLSQRLLLATVLASLVFMFYPLRFSHLRPAIESPFIADLYMALSIFDRPHNQLPSLHVAYCVIFWQSLRTISKLLIVRILLGVCLFSVGIATLFTYQHHLLDIVAGLALGTLCIASIKPNQKQVAVAFYYLIMATTVFIVGALFLHSWFAIYLAGSLLLIAYAYQTKNRNFLHKRSGTHPWFIQIAYAPYLLGYRLTWLLVQYRERHAPALAQFSPQLWVGRRLTKQQADQLPDNLSIIDLSPELSETKTLRLGDYQHFALLDLVPPESAVINEIIQAIHKKIERGQNVYLHCAMGYQRSIAIAQQATMKTSS